jgi:hypothetical protein
LEKNFKPGDVLNNLNYGIMQTVKIPTQTAGVGGVIFGFGAGAFHQELVSRLLKKKSEVEYFEQLPTSETENEKLS